MKHPWTKAEAWGKATAALLGGFVLFVAVSLAMPILLPRLGLSLPASLALSTALSVPIWMGVMVGAAVAPNGRSAWFRIGVSSCVLFASIAGCQLWMP